jgi:hypothetical protein
MPFSRFSILISSVRSPVVGGVVNQPGKDGPLTTFRRTFSLLVYVFAYDAERHELHSADKQYGGED